MRAFSYDSSPYPIRSDLKAAYREYWHALALLARFQAPGHLSPHDPPFRSDRPGHSHHRRGRTREGSAGREEKVALPECRAMESLGAEGVHAKPGGMAQDAAMRVATVTAITHGGCAAPRQRQKQCYFLSTTIHMRGRGAQRRQC